MDVLAIELNDAGIRAARSGEAGLLALDGGRSSPGVALRRGGSLEVGAAAAAQAWLDPLHANDRFWDQLDTEPAEPGDPRSPNRAELAWTHLGSVLEGVRGAGEPVVLAVPAFYERRQLGILVGIARELDLPLQGIVAAPIAVEPDQPCDGQVLVVDVTLHRAALSTVERGDRVRLGPTRLCPDVGLGALRRQWIKAIAEESVRTTRFDPLHDAVTEQRLHDRLPELLETLAREGSHLLEVAAGGTAQRITVTDQLLEHAGHGLIFRLCDEIRAASRSASAVLLTHETALVPGLRRALEQQLTVPLHGLPAGAAATGLAGLWPERFDAAQRDGVAYHTARNCGTAPVTPLDAGAQAG